MLETLVGKPWFPKRPATVVYRNLKDKIVNRTKDFGASVLWAVLKCFELLWVALGCSGLFFVRDHPCHPVNVFGQTNPKL